MSDLPGFARAQAQWEAMSPPEDGPCECPECNGTGTATIDTPEWRIDEDCANCDGFGWIDENGEPFDPHKAEREADDYADHQRDEARLA